MNKKWWEKQETKYKMIDLKPTISIITINVNGLNTQVKTKTVTLDKKVDSTLSRRNPL